MIRRKSAAGYDAVDVRVMEKRLAPGVKDGEETDRFEFKLIDATTAELALVITDDMRKELASEGISDFKPFKLKKLARK